MFTCRMCGQCCQGPAEDYSIVFNLYNCQWYVATIMEKEVPM